MADFERVGSSAGEKEGGKEKNKGRNWMLLFLLAGILICLKGYFDLREGVTSYGWSSTQGTVTSSEVKMEKRMKEAPSYYPEIVYDYEVGGKKYRGERIFIGDYGSASEADARSLVKKYPIGKTVLVFYNPQNPDQAVLERGVRPATFVLVFIGIIFGLVGLGGYTWWDKLHTRPKWLERADEMRPYYKK